jgi:hypothetical protein
MARNSSKVTKVVEVLANVNEAALESAGAASRDMALIQSTYAEERDLINQMLGQIQMSNAIARFSDVVGLSKLQYIKETKLYRALKGKKATAPDGTKISDVGTFEGFCQALGLSYSKVNEDLLNLSTFGEDALKQLSAIGAGYREMRQYRKLPDDDKSALLEAAKSGDKDAFIDLAETLVVKHQKEKADLQAKITDSAEDHKATEKVLVTRTERLTAVETALEKLQLRAAPWDERVASFKEDTTTYQSDIDKAVGQHLKSILALDDWLTVELVNEPGYDPDSANPMPLEVLTAILHLSNAIDNAATLVANAQFELRNRFGGDIDQARVQLLVKPA